MRTPARLTFLLALLALSACDLLAPTRLEPDRPIVAEPPPNVVEPPQVEVQRLEPEDALVNRFAARIERFLIGPDGRTVVAVFTGGLIECYGLAEVQVTEGGVPSIGVVGGSRPGTGCDAIGVPSSVLVTLEEPILVDIANPEAGAGEGEIFPGATQVVVEGGIADPRPHAVWGYGLTPDGLTLSIYFGGGTQDCYGLASVEVDTSGGRPASVLVQEGTRPLGDLACPDIGVAKVVTVQLAEPLLVDAAGGQ